MRVILPVKPARIDPLAEELLTGLGGCPAARHFVLGGYFALKHYCDYRVTHDVDAWWNEDSTEPERAAAREGLDEVLSSMARSHGYQVMRRHFGDTESWELCRDQKKVFSFQIATRTLQLEPALPSPWPPLRIETLADNLGSKMNALVQRGAPRDLLDIRQAVAAGLVTPQDCWELWERKNPGLAVQIGKMEVARRLEELELRRPLRSLADAAERERAAAARAWYRNTFLQS